MKANINKQLVSLTLVNLFYCFGIYLTLPVLALYFNIDSHLSAFQVGILLGVPPVVSAFMGYLSAPISRRLGVVNSMNLGLMIMAGSYLSYIYFKSFPLLLTSSVVLGFSRVLWEPVIKFLFTYHAQDAKIQEMMFRLKYITICLGAILGPLAGMYISTFGKEYNLLVSILIFLLLAIILLMGKSSLSTADNLKEKSVYFTNLLKVDHTLISYIIGGTLVFIVFSQFETIFSLTLKEFSTNPEKLFSSLLILNSISGIILQFVVLFMAKKLNHITSLLIGNLAFALAYCLYAFSNGTIYSLILATVIFSLGEVLAIPSGDILINDIAPEDKKTLYFGLAEFRILGFSLGPICAGFILEGYGRWYMFMSSVLITLLAMLIYYLPTIKFKMAGDKKNRAEIL